MFRLKSISLQFRLFLVGISLLSVLFLDKREVAISLQKPVAEHTVKAATKQLVIKEKVSFEAVASYVALPAAILPDLQTFHFAAPAVVAAKIRTLIVPVAAPLFRRLLVTAISPNAP